MRVTRRFTIDFVRYDLPIVSSLYPIHAKNANKLSVPLIKYY